jgi:5-methylcytosine-specific restriction endonuclease McrA
MDEDAHGDLRCLQDLLRRDIPDGDPAAIVARALKLLRLAAEKRAFSATSKPRPDRTSKAGSRDIPASVERAVWRRDGGQCAFVAKNGRRCTERSYLEYHHTNEPHALGGEPTVENISLHCRAHNVYESEMIFGPFDPSRVREAPATYERSARPVTGPGTSNQL